MRSVFHSTFNISIIPSLGLVTDMLLFVFLIEKCCFRQYFYLTPTCVRCDVSTCAQNRATWISLHLVMRCFTTCILTENLQSSFTSPLDGPRHSQSHPVIGSLSQTAWREVVFAAILGDNPYVVPHSGVYAVTQSRSSQPCCTSTTTIALVPWIHPLVHRHVITCTVIKWQRHLCQAADCSKNQYTLNCRAVAITWWWRWRVINITLREKSLTRVNHQWEISCAIR